eukprot:GGOE01021562.1.p1 GENE.GGOE01021562.1~~GGOE01021562.1.p1  ORF type:complete len:733 (+),score=209.24 GGOE01021562.1:61-2259(+)
MVAILLIHLLGWVLLASWPDSSQGGRVSVKFADKSVRRKDKEHCFLVRLKDGAPSKSRQDMFNRTHGEGGGMWSNAFQGFYKCNASLEQLHNLTNNSWVESIEEDAVVTASTVESVSSTLWNLDRIDQHTTTGDGSFQYEYTGQGVYIYVLDTGILGTHQEFTGRVTDGKDFVGDGASPTNDCEGHGTHVSGIAAGTNVGVAKSATIVPVRVLDCSGSGTYSTIISALDWVATQSKPGVINLSLGGSASLSLNGAVNSMVTKGFHVAVAAGNNAADACSYSPASATSVITAGSTTSTDAMSSFSNYGSCVDIFSPGSTIFSAYNTANDAYATMSGTSMASPLVAGTVAAYLQANPSMTPASMVTYLKNVATSNVLTALPSSASPNLLLYSAASLAASPTSPSPSPSPDPSTSPASSASPNPSASKSPAKPSPSHSPVSPSRSPSHSPHRPSPSPSPSPSKKCTGWRCIPDNSRGYRPGWRVAVTSMFDDSTTQLWGYPAHQWTRIAQLSDAARQELAERITGSDQQVYPEGFHAEVVASQQTSPFALPQREAAQVTITNWGRGVAKAIVTEFDTSSVRLSEVVGAKVSTTGDRILSAFQVDRLSEDGQIANASPFHISINVPSSKPFQVFLYTPANPEGSDLLSQGGRIEAVSDDVSTIVVPYSALVVIRSQQLRSLDSFLPQPTNTLLLALLLSFLLSSVVLGWRFCRLVLQSGSTPGESVAEHKECPVIV